MDAIPKAFLAPMAGVGDLSFRRMCLIHGAALTYTEMVSAKGLAYASKKTHNLISIAPEEKFAAVQIFGHEPDTMAEQAKRIEDEFAEKLAFIDINMGCPARKIVSKGDGSALMKSPMLAGAIVEKVSAAIKHPVTVKFRRGYYLDEDISLDFARIMQNSGASAVAIHGRYAMQYYHGNADWDCIGRIKDALHIPVIGNGDIKSAQDALDMVSQTGCDHIMIGRQAMGDPWIFERVKCAFSGENPPNMPDISKRIEAMMLHLEFLSEEGEGALIRMRKHAAAYVKGLPGATAMRRELNTCTTFDDFKSLFNSFAKYCSSLNLDKAQ